MYKNEGIVELTVLDDTKIKVFVTVDEGDKTLNQEDILDLWDVVEVNGIEVDFAPPWLVEAMKKTGEWDCFPETIWQAVLRDRAADIDD